MELEYSGILKENLKSGLNLSVPNTTRTRHIKNIKDRRYSNMLDWIDLPDMSQSDINAYIEYGNWVRKKYDNFVVLGIGGSALGIKMLKNTFVDSVNKNIGIKVIVCDNIDGDSFVSLVDNLNLKKTMFNVITKSGTTSETLAQMSLVMERLQNKKLKFSDHFCVTTTRDNDLYNYAKGLNIQTFDIPRGVGGRFSVLSAVGLVPACVMGIDISALLSGAKEVRNICFEPNINNIAYTCAYINYTYFTKGLNNLVLMPYSDRLALLPDFFAQLWAESLGKKFNRDGEIVNTGSTPIKTLGVTDQHSQLQLYSEGTKDKLIMFVTVKKKMYDSIIKCDLPFAKHINGTTFNTLMNYEYESTAYSLTTLDRPNYTWVLDDISERTIGELIFIMEMMTAYAGEMLNIDAFDQPGVELSKIYTKACLKQKGYEKEYKEIKNFSLNKKFFSTNNR